MTQQPCVTVSVVSHEHGDEIPHFLSDLTAFAARNVAEVIVTLNVPETTLSDWIEAREWPFRITILRNEVPLGYGANHNQAFAHCQTPYFCVVNPDIRLPRDPFAPLIATLQAPGAGCAYPMQSNGDRVPRDRAREVPSFFALLRRYLVPGYRSRPQPRHWINGSFMLFPSAVYALLQGFDPRYFMYCEDVDICLRLQLKGYRLLPVSGVTVEHEAEHASRRRLRHLIWHVRSLWRMWHSAAYADFLALPVSRGRAPGA